MSVNATSSLSQKPAVRFIKDVSLAVSLPFRRGAEKIEPLSTIAIDIEQSGRKEISTAHEPTIYSSACFSVVQKARLKIAEIKASQGRYGEAIQQCETLIAIAPDFSKQSLLPLAFKTYYEAKIEQGKVNEATAEKAFSQTVYHAASKESEAHNHSSKAAELMEQSCMLFFKAKKLSLVLEIGEKAIGIYEQIGATKKVVEMCESLALIAYDRLEYARAANLYGKAASLGQGANLAEDAKMAEIARSQLTMQSWSSYPSTS